MRVFGLEVKRAPAPRPRPAAPASSTARQISLILDGRGGIGASYGFGLYGGYGRRPYEWIRRALQWDTDGYSLTWESRIASRTSELLLAYLARVEAATLKAGRSGGMVERPCFPRLPADAANVAAEVGEAWERYWTDELAEGPAGPLDGPALESLALRTALAEGEVHVLPLAGGRVQVLGGDDIKGPELDAEGRVLRWTYRSGASRGRAEVIQVANLQSLRQVRGRSFLAPALPAALALMDHQDAAAFGAAVMAKIAGSIETMRDGALATLPGLGGKTADISGVVDDDYGGGDSGEGKDNVPTSHISSTQTGSIVVLAPGEKISPPDYGPPEQSLKLIAYLEAQVAAALGLSRPELTGDYSMHNFASLQVADRKDRATYEGLRQWWYRSFRRPLFRRALPRLLMETAPGYAEHADALMFPAWHGPRLESAQPVRDLDALAKSAELGLVSLADVARADGEDAAANVAANAKLKSATMPEPPAPNFGKGEEPAATDDEESPSPTPPAEPARHANGRLRP